MTDNRGDGRALLELAERVEAAAGPNRIIGREVLWACGKRSPTDIGLPINAEDPTASLDAAMTLVPEGTRALIDSDGCHCRLTRDDYPWNGFAGFAGTMPQAVVAAALRAIAATKDNQHA